jgi:hypothetical protein
MGEMRLEGPKELEESYVQRMCATSLLVLSGRAMSIESVRLHDYCWVMSSSEPDVFQCPCAVSILLRLQAQVLQARFQSTVY